MIQPMGRIVALDMRNVAREPGGDPTVPVLRVHMQTHSNEVDHHDLINDDYSVQNSALQFMALYGYQPSDINGRSETYINVEEGNIIVPIVPKEGEASWGLSRSALRGGERALREAEWFNGKTIEDRS